MKAMSPAQRRSMKQGEIFAVRIIRNRRPLKRWGADDNTAKIAVGGQCCRIYRNNLVDRSWNNDQEKANEEARDALDFFVYGDPTEYRVVIM